MKTLFIPRLFTILLVYLSLASCSKDDSNSQEPAAHPSITIESAQEWFTKNVSSARIGSTSILNDDLVWQYASKSTMKGTRKDEVVVVPIPHSRDTKIPTFKQIWIYDDHNGERTARIFEYIYDLRSNKFNSLKKFSGALIVRDLGGNFLGGLKVNHNKIEGFISEINSETGQKETLTSSNNARSNNFVCGSGITCRGWTITVGPSSVSGMNCDTDFNCWWVNTNALDPAFTGYIIDIPSYPLPPASGSGGPIEQLPGPTSYGFANDKCRGFTFMLQAQREQNVEIAGIVTKMGQVFMFPTKENTKHRVNYSDVYMQPNGYVMMRIFVGNPDPVDPANDGKYKDNVAYIEMYDYETGKPTNWEIEGFIHTHPIEEGYNYHQPSDEDIANANAFSNSESNYILTEQRLIKYEANGHFQRISNPCK